MGQSLRTEIRDKSVTNDFNKCLRSLEEAKSFEKLIKNFQKSTSLFEGSIKSVLGFKSRKHSFQINGTKSVNFEERKSSKSTAKLSNKISETSDTISDPFYQDQQQRINYPQPEGQPQVKQYGDSPQQN